MSSHDAIGEAILGIESAVNRGIIDFVQPHLETISVEVDRLRAALTDHEIQLQNWRDCYPENVFIPLTDEQLKEVVALLKDNGWTPDAVFSHWGRHIVKCLAEPLAAAVSGSKPA